MMQKRFKICDAERWAAIRFARSYLNHPNVRGSQLSKNTLFI